MPSKVEPANTDELTTALNNLFTAGRLHGFEGVSPDDWAREIGMATDVIERLITAAEIRGYKKGYMDGAIAEIHSERRLNGACPVCGADPMTTECNGANCKPKEN